VSPDNDPLRDPALYINRELSQLDFNFRVLAQAMDPQVPLLERLRFMCISCTNLDEFFEIRAAAVRHAQEFGLPPAPDGMSPQAILNAIHDRAAELVDQQYRCWNETLRPALMEAGIGVLGRHSWTDAPEALAARLFPQRDHAGAVAAGPGPAHPFPKILNKSLNIVVVLKGTDAFGRAGHLAIVRAPRSLPRIIQLPEKLGGSQNFVFLSSVLSTFVDELFPGMEVQGAYQFRVTRNSELVVDEEEVENLALALRDELVDRGYRPAVRLEIAHDCPRDRAHPAAEFRPDRERGVPHRRPGQPQPHHPAVRPDRAPDLKYPPMTPRTLRDSDGIFETARAGRAAAPPVRCVHRGAGPDPAGGDRSQRAGDQADAVPHRQGFADRRCADPGRAQRQGRHRGGRTARALRRRGQPRPGRSPAGSRRAGGVRRGRLQDPRQDAADRAPRGPQAAPLRAPGHRQLPQRHRPRVHRHQPDHRRCGHRQRRAPAVPAAVRAGLEDEAQAPAAVAVHPAHRHPRPHRARDAHRRRRQARRGSSPR
jgi:hypothetical protein